MVSTVTSLPEPLRSSILMSDNEGRESSRMKHVVLQDDCARAAEPRAFLEPVVCTVISPTVIPNL